MTTNNPGGLEPDPGSFRDPQSQVFVDGDRVWRGLSSEALDDYRSVAASSFFSAALERGDIVATRETTDAPDLRDPLGEPWAGVLEHDRVPVVSYPFEWPFEMLRDAARLQLRLTSDAIDAGFVTKDASAYNVQFDGVQPVFIDVGSFERLRKGEPWAGYRQFCELFLNPLYVQAIAGVPFQPLLRARLDGISPELTADVLGRRGTTRRGVFTHVRLHARAQRRYADADRERDVRAELQRAGFGPALLAAQVRNLAKAVERLTWKQQSSTWSDYSDRAHYTDVDLAEKERFVADTTARAKPRLVLDLGANDGRFSKVAVDAGAARAVAVDFDDVVIDQLYRRLRSEGERRILPLILDLANPSPALGWRNRERPSFVDRVRPDLTLCLAVVHHLALTNNVPLPGVVALLADFGAPVVVEFPHPDDVMASRLLARKRAGLFDTYTIENWERALDDRFEVHAKVELPSGTRTLYHCTPR